MNPANNLFSVLLALSVVCATPALAQNVASGAIAGQVTDQQGAAVSGATLTLTEISINSVTTTRTNEAGRYVFPTVAPGTYDLTVAKEGFSLAKVSSQKVEVGIALTLNVSLQLGQTATTIEVHAQAGAELQVMNATVGSTITGDSLQLLPNLGRDASPLAVLQVGVTPFGTTAGADFDQNSFQLDGGNNSSDVDGTNARFTPSNGYTGTSSFGGSTSGVMPTPVESIEEFKIGTSNQTADFAGAGGSQVQMVTKRGTNEIHGSAYEHYFATNVGAANYWKNNHTPSGGLPYTPLPSSHRNRFGFAGGGPLTPRFWGGKTYIFANYEGFRFPQTITFEKAVPSVLLRNGIIQIPNTAGVYQPYNLNNVPVTVNGVTYQPATCSNGSFCDPRGLGFNPIVKQIWQTMMPLPNDPQYLNANSDGVNQQGYLGNIRLPQNADFFVVRLDHDFGDKWKFMSSYRYYRYSQASTSQVDIGGALPGDQLGVPASTAPRPQKPSYLVAGLTGTITPNLTNDFRVSYLRNFWQWSTAGSPPQLPGLGGAVELGGESAGLDTLIPYNVDAKNVQRRLWDGQDKLFRDDLSLLHGKHLLQFGGSYQRNFDYHQRDNNGAGTDTSPVYQITNGNGIAFPSAFQPANLPATQASTWNNLYAQVLGLVSQPQVAYTRKGKSLTLNPVGTPAFAQSILPTYNAYFSDTWRWKPTFTLTYGLAYTLEMPPYEINGKQVELVDQGGKPIALSDYLARKKQAAVNGQVYEPTVGFATVRNIGNGQKYPFDPFYGGFSPRLAAAWNPNFDNGILGAMFGHEKTVIRGGYSRIYGRLNGNLMVASPMLGTGLLQAVSCIGASQTGQCLGSNGVDPSTAFRIGKDGMAAPLPPVSQTLPQPYSPGVNGNAAAGDGYEVDPNLKPDRSDEINFTIQRALSQKLVIEAGYIGRIIKNEVQSINIDAVPYMTTLGGQSFASAYATLYNELSSGATPLPQPFFEAALGGSSSSYCAGFASCTAAVASKLKSSILATQVYSLWNIINAAPSWTLGRTLLSSPAHAGGLVGSQLSALMYDASLGYGNYNAAFLSFTAKDWHGVTARSNFTWSRAMGTGSVPQYVANLTVIDPWNLHASYGPQPFDLRFVYNSLAVYQPPYFKSQNTWLSRVLGGWSIAPVFTAQSGAPLQVNVGTGANADAQAFGEIYGNNKAFENAVLTGPFTGGNSTHYNVAVSSGPGVSGNPSRGGSGINLFANPNAIYALFRRPILGLDTTDGGAGVIRGLPSWSLDTTISKDIRIRERFGATLIFQITNVLNHFQPDNPALNIDSPSTWGVITQQSTTGLLSVGGGIPGGNAPGGVPAINPRQMEFGLRLHF